MFKVGLTGNIGSGKTTVARVFEILGIPVFYADNAAKQVMTTDAELVTQVKQIFGDDAYFDDSTLNRKFIANIVFNNADELAKLNAVVHPTVFRAFKVWADEQRAPYVIKEAAILFESGSYKLCNDTVLVTAPTEQRLARVMARDGITLLEAQARNNRQMAESKKENMAGHIIINDGLQLVIPQVLTLHQQLLAIASK